MCRNILSNCCMCVCLCAIHISFLHTNQKNNEKGTKKFIAKNKREKKTKLAAKCMNGGVYNFRKK